MPVVFRRTFRYILAVQSHAALADIDVDAFLHELELSPEAEAVLFVTEGPLSAMQRQNIAEALVRVDIRFALVSTEPESLALATGMTWHGAQAQSFHTTDLAAALRYAGVTLAEQRYILGLVAELEVEVGLLPEHNKTLLGS